MVPRGTWVGCFDLVSGETAERERASEEGGERAGRGQGGYRGQRRSKQAIITERFPNKS